MFYASELLSRPISTSNIDCKIIYFSASCLINESFWLENTPSDMMRSRNNAQCFSVFKLIYAFISLQMNFLFPFYFSCCVFFSLICCCFCCCCVCGMHQPSKNGSFSFRFHWHKCTDWCTEWLWIFEHAKINITTNSKWKNCENKSRKFPFLIELKTESQPNGCDFPLKYAESDRKLCNQSN